MSQIPTLPVKGNVLPPPPPKQAKSAVKSAGYSTKLFYKEAPPRGPTPYPFYNHFKQKRYPFPIPSIDKWYLYWGTYIV